MMNDTAELDLDQMTAANTFAMLAYDIPYSAAQLSQAIYNCMCRFQRYEYAHGRNEDESVEIAYSIGYGCWQIIIYDQDENPKAVRYWDLTETTFADWPVDLLWDICKNLLIDEAAILDPDLMMEPDDE